MTPIQTLHTDFCRYLHAERGMTAATIKGHREVFSTFLNRTGINDIGDMTLSMFRQYFYDGVEVRRWEPSTFHLNHSYLSSFCAWLIKRGYLKTNPLESIEKPKLKKPLPRRLSK